MDALIFARISSKEQEEGLSPEHQILQCKEYAQKNGFNIIKEVSITESSYKGDRTEFFAEVMDYIKKKTTSCISR